MRNSYILILVLALWLISGCNKKPSNELVPGLNGEWTVVSVEEGGAPVPEGELKESSVLIEGDEFRVHHGPGSNEGVMIKVDASKHPAEIDMIGNGHYPQVGIFKLEGDTLTICTKGPTSHPTSRPTEFTAPLNSRRTLMVLKRKT